MNNDNVKKLKFPQAVAFDKDGTLLSYYSFWYPVITGVLNAVFNEYSAPREVFDEIMRVSGVSDGKTDINGALVSTTHENFSDNVIRIIAESGIKVDREKAKEVYYKALKESLPHGEILPLCESQTSDLVQLKEMGVKLFLITNDIRKPTEHCLKKLKILGLFDEIITAEEWGAKPNPDSMKYLVNKYGFSKDRVYMVGDTITDMKYANAAEVVGIGFADSEKNAKILSEHTKIITKDTNSLLKIIKDLRD